MHKTQTLDEIYNFLFVTCPKNWAIVKNKFGQRLAINVLTLVLAEV